MNFGKKALSEKLDMLRTQDARQKNRFKIFVLASAVALTIGLLVILASMGLGAFRQIIDNSPSISNLDTIKPTATKSIIYAADGSIMQELIQSGSNRETVTYEQVPEDLVYAFVAIEDSRFFSHDGVDVKGLIRAVFRALTTGHLREGASTITQQLIKNNVFDGGAESNLGDRIERKIQEQYLALKVEQELDKETIMQYYLNTINLGSNCLGVQTASHRYFNKDVSELDLSECSVLASITQNPSKYNPITHPDQNQKRRLTVLKYMLNDGYITQEEYNEACSEDVYRRIQTVAADYDSDRTFSYFTDTVFTQVLEALQEELDITETQAYNMLYSGGLRIYTTMEPTIQEIIDEEVNDPENYTNGDTEYLEYALTYRLSVLLPDGSTAYYDESNVKAYFQDTLGQTAFKLVFESKDALERASAEFRDVTLDETNGSVVSERVTATIEPQTSVVVIDQETGHVLGVSGGRGDKKEIGSLVLNRATASTRQPGSTFKVLTAYAPALDTCGATLATTYYDSYLSYNDKSISNWWGSQYLGYATMDFAIMASMNVVAVKCFENTVSERTGFNYAEDFGITTLVAQDINPVMTIGGLTYGVTNLELTAAYATIANDGVYVEPVFWVTVTDENGNVLLENTQTTRRVLKSTTSKLLTTSLQRSIYPDFGIWNEYGVGSTSVACQVDGMDVAGKSGTTNNANDVWFVGYSPNVTLGIWSGYDSNKTFGKSPGYHKEIWQKIMQRISDTQEEARFDYSGLETAEICSKSGLLAREGICDDCGDPNAHVYMEYFAPGTVPTEYCNRHVVYNICSESGALANEFCPPEGITEKVFLVIDPEDNDGLETDDTKYTAPAELTEGTCTLHGAPEETTEEETSSEAEPEDDTADSTTEDDSEIETPAEESTETTAEEPAPEDTSADGTSLETVEESAPGSEEP